MSSIRPTTQTIEFITDYHDGVTITYQVVNQKIEGLAWACFTDHGILYLYKDGIKNGPAIKSFNDGSSIEFTYYDDVPQGPAVKVLTDGSLIHFFYRNGIAEKLT